MTAAKVMDIICRCRVAMDKQQTQYRLIPKWKWKMLTNYSKFQSWHVQTFWIRLPRHKWPKSWSNLETQSFFLSGICTVILWQDCCGKGNLGKSYWNMAGRNSKLGMSLCTSWKSIILICVCGWHEIGWKKQNLDPRWKLLYKDVDSGAPTSFLDHVHLGCTQRQCQISKDIVDNYRTMFESRNSMGGVEKLPFPLNFLISSWSYDIEGHGKKCVERHCELANKTSQQLFKVSTLCIDEFH